MAARTGSGTGRVTGVPGRVTAHSDAQAPGLAPLSTSRQCHGGETPRTHGRGRQRPPHVHQPRAAAGSPSTSGCSPRRATPALPLYERLKFLAIAAEQPGRVLHGPGGGHQAADGLGGDRDRGRRDVARPSSSRPSPPGSGRWVSCSIAAWRDELLPLLQRHGVDLVTPAALGRRGSGGCVREHFRSVVFPALTPLAVDPGHPFPHLRNKSLNLAVLLRREGRRRGRRRNGVGDLAVVQVPTVLSRLVPVPAADGPPRLRAARGPDRRSTSASSFPGSAWTDWATFRVTRNWDLNVDEEESEDLLSTIQEELRRRDRGDGGAAGAGRAGHAGARGVAAPLPWDWTLEDVYRTDGPLAALGPDCPGGSGPPAGAASRAVRARAAPAAARRREPLPGPRPGRRAAPPPLRVLRPGGPASSRRPPTTRTCWPSSRRCTAPAGDSPIVRALSRAAENGKQVAALVELKARLDEANNIAWARRHGGGRRPRGLRAHRPEDALQGGAGGAPRGPGHPPLRAPRHRQLQRRRPRGSTPTSRSSPPGRRWPTT